MFVMLLPRWLSGRSNATTALVDIYVLPSVGAGGGAPARTMPSVGAGGGAPARTMPSVGAGGGAPARTMPSVVAGGGAPTYCLRSGLGAEPPYVHSISYPYNISMY